MRLLLAAGGLAALVTLSACSSSHVTSSPTTSASSTPVGSTSSTATGGPQISIDSFAYSGTLTVKPGATVHVVNHDSVPHTLTDTGKFDTGNLAGGGGQGTFVAPTTPGSYKFGCSYHPRMAGVLIVQS